MNEILYWIWFQERSMLCTASTKTLLEALGSAEEVYRCSNFSCYPNMSAKDITIFMNKNLDDAERILHTSNTLGIRIITYDSDLYPANLREITNPPYVLYAKGNIFDFNNTLHIGIVGTRHCSEYGVSVTRRFCSEMADYGIVTISGMARGIDTEVAYSTLNSGGMTIAVLGCGIDVCYPPENYEIMEMVEKKGLLLSEFPPGTPPLNFHFPMRNRIISGISHGILIIESAKKGGSLITANLAIEQGKDVFAIPGSIFNKNSEGTNKLISSTAARAVTSVADIVDDFSYRFSPKKVTVSSATPVDIPSGESSFFENFSGTERQIAELLLSGPLYAGEIQQLLDIPVAEFSNSLSVLEFSGVIERASGNIYKLKI